MLALALLAAIPAKAQTQVYSQNFETDTSSQWVVNTTPQTTSTNVSAAFFFFDYSTVGIPSAPHSVGGTTHGLKLIDNCGPTPSALISGLPSISVSPTNFNLTGNFDMHWDQWLNYNGAGPAGTSTNGGNGSTIFGGAGYGTAGTSAQGAGVADSIFCGVTLDGGSSADYRLYAPNYPGSYQDAALQITGNPASGTVYAATNRNNSAVYYTGIFPATPCPAAETNIFAQQTGLTAPAGAIAFAWHDVEMKKIANVITFLIDGHVIATANATDAGNPAGTFIEFVLGDINATGSTDVQATNLQFLLIDNVTITNFPNIVTVAASQSDASEVGPAPGAFTITRTSAGQPLTVHYTMSGTATNGVNYQAVSGSVTFSALATETNVTITPIDDGIPEVTMTAILTIVPGSDYVGAGSDTVNIADADTPTIDVSATRAQAYDRYTNDFILYHVTRRGLLTADLTVNLTYSGTAVGGTDYVVTNGIDVAAGAQGADFSVYPIPNPAVTGNRTVLISAAAGTGYSVGTGPATGTIVDSDYASAPVLLTDSLASAADASNWAITYGTGDPTNNSANFNVDFGFALATAVNAPVPPPPGGSATALHVTCNKLNGAGAAGAVNVYYTNKFLSGNYAVRFNMNLIEGSTLGFATEGVVFGINHSGIQSNWWYGSGPITTNNYTSDGVWYYVAAEAVSDNIGDYHEYTGLGGTNGNTGWTRLATLTESSFTDVFKNTPGPFTAVDGTGVQSSGVPANAAPIAYDASTWSDVEIKQIGSNVTLSINHTPIFKYANTTVWQSGYLMLGYADPYGGANGSSVGAADAGAYYANLQVVQLTAPAISSTTLNGGNVTLAFSSPDSSATFILQSSSNVGGPYTDVPNGVVTPLGNGQYQATGPQIGDQQFYRLRYK